MPALHVPNIGGSIDAALGDNSGGLDVTISSPALNAVGEIAAPDFMWICVDPDGRQGAPEWMRVTTHAAATATATVIRGEQGSTARAHRPGTHWVHTLAPDELEILSRLSSGNGTPEGAVEAPVGSMYLRDDGGAGTTLYIKESGTGNTGWVAK